jgi:predicted DNA-binding antitoxin AbrB/MazE fold protein
MSQTIEAVYENGVFRPLRPVTLASGTRVLVEAPHEPETAEEIDERIRQELSAEGALPEEIEKALATLRQLRQCFEGLTEEQLRMLDEARLDQVNFFNHSAQ